MATHSSILAWKIPWTEEPGGLQSMQSKRVGRDWACVQASSVIIYVFLFWKRFPSMLLTNRPLKIVQKCRPLNLPRVYFSTLWSARGLAISCSSGPINVISSISTWWIGAIESPESLALRRLCLDSLSVRSVSTALEQHEDCFWSSF